MRELVVSLTKQSQGTSLLMELGGLVRHVCIDGIEYLRRHGDHQGEVWMVQFFFSPKHREEFIVLDEPTELAARALAYLFLGSLPKNSVAVLLKGEPADEARKRMDARPTVV